MKKEFIVDKSRRLVLGIILFSLILVGGCSSQQQCVEYREVSVCENLYRVYHVPLNYTGNLNLSIEMGSPEDVKVKFVEDLNITEPYVEPSEPNGFYCGSIGKKLVCDSWI